MNKYEFFKACKVDLQIFAGEGTGNEGAPTAPEGNEGEGNDPKEPVSFSQEDVNRIVNERVNRAIKNYTKTLEEEKKKEEAARLKNMTEQEKKDQQLSNALKELEQMKQKQHTSEMMSTARSVIQDRGHSFSDTIIAGLIRDNAETTKECIDEFIDTFEKAVKEEVKKSVHSTTPKAGKKVSTLTKDQIMAISDTRERQRKIRENLSLFK